MILRTRAQGAPVRGGFTLMEMLAVVAIMVILAGAAVPLYMRYMDQAKVDVARTTVKVLEQTCEAYKLKNGDFPVSLEVLAQPQPDGTMPYLKPEDLLDPWKHEFQYAPQGPHNAAYGKPDIWSLGPHLNDQIGNWTPGL